MFSTWWRSRALTDLKNIDGDRNELGLGLNEFKFEGDNWTSEIILGSEDNTFSNVE